MEWFINTIENFITNGVPNLLPEPWGSILAPILYLVFIAAVFLLPLGAIWLSLSIILQLFMGVPNVLGYFMKKGGDKLQPQAETKTKIVFWTLAFIIVYLVVTWAEIDLPSLPPIGKDIAYELGKLPEKLPKVEIGSVNIGYTTEIFPVVPFELQVEVLTLESGRVISNTRLKSWQTDPKTGAISLRESVIENMDPETYMTELGQLIENKLSKVENGYPQYDERVINELAIPWITAWNYASLPTNSEIYRAVENLTFYHLTNVEYDLSLEETPINQASLLDQTDYDRRLFGYWQRWFILSGAETGILTSNRDAITNSRDIGRLKKIAEQKGVLLGQVESLSTTTTLQEQAMTWFAVDERNIQDLLDKLRSGITPKPDGLKIESQSSITGTEKPVVEKAKTAEAKMESEPNEPEGTISYPLLNIIFGTLFVVLAIIVLVIVYATRR